jgi:nitrogen fixation-related uncharacterized protein
MSGTGYALIIFIIGALFFMTAVIALYWASKNGQLRDFDKNANTVFEGVEAEGFESDQFPNKRNKENS